MLKRTKLRKYLKAVLWHTDVDQSPDCIKGPLYINCDGEQLPITDHDTHQVEENESGESRLKNNSASINFVIDSINYTLSPSKVEEGDIRFTIHITACASDGRKRQEILDEIELKIFYRLFSHQSFTDQTTNETLDSFMGWISQNTLTVNVTDDSDFNGDNTIREMTFSFKFKECVKQLNCNLQPICFDFSKLESIGSC